MADKNVSAPELQAALTRGAQKRMDERVKMWLSNPKVVNALDRFDSSEIEQKKAS